MRAFRLIVVLLTLTAALASAAIPNLISFQGKLTDGSGVPVADGAYDLTFKLYASPTDPPDLWSESQNAVSVQGGLYHVLLGSVTSLATVDFRQQLYLGIAVGADAEMAPRFQLASSPSALAISDVLTLTQLGMTPQLLPPAVGAGIIYYDATDNVLKCYNGLAWVSLTAGAANTLQASYDAGNVISENATSPVALSSADVTHDVLTLDGGHIGLTITNPFYKGIAVSGAGDCGVYSTTSASWGNGLFGSASGPNGFGVSGVSSAATGTGVYGEGGLYGVYGGTTVANGYGVWGLGSSSSGEGVHGVGGNAGLRGEGGTYGCYAATGNDGGYGVWGEGSAATGEGVHGSGGHAGLRGEGGTYGCYASTGNDGGYGVWGEGSSATGEGVHGVGGNAGLRGDGGNFGCYATASSATGEGVHGEGSDTGILGLGGNYGCYASADNDNGYGVWGGASSATGEGVHGYGGNAGLRGDGGNYGCYASASSSGGEGVHGVGANAGLRGEGGTYGCYASTGDRFGYGVVGVANDDQGEGVHGQGSIGVYGVGSSAGGKFICSGNPGVYCLLGTGSTGLYATSSAGHGVEGISTSSDIGDYGVCYIGGLGGSGIKSCVERTSTGPRLMYCQESPENWFEDFGSATVSGGRCRVNLRPDFAEVITVDDANPLRVFITPNDFFGDWCVKKDGQGFTVLAPHAPEGATFDWRIAAKRQNFTERRMDLVESAYNDAYLYPEYMGILPREVFDRLKAGSGIDYEKYRNETLSRFTPFQSSPYNTRYLLANWQAQRDEAKRKVNPTSGKSVGLGDSPAPLAH